MEWAILDEVSPKRTYDDARIDLTFRQTLAQSAEPV